MWEGILPEAFKQTKPVLSFFIGIVAFIFILKVIAILLTKKRKKKYVPHLAFDSASNLDILSKAEFNKSVLMNKSEQLLFYKLGGLLETKHEKQYFKLFPQVSMGEFIQSRSTDAFKLINSKRVDFLIVDKQFNPVIVIEYQGNGHYQNNAIERDAIKRECCRKAKIEYIEFKQNYDELDFQRISKILNNTYQN